MNQNGRKGTFASIRDVWVALVSIRALATITATIGGIDTVTVATNTSVGSSVLFCFLAFFPFNCPIQDSGNHPLVRITEYCGVDISGTKVEC
uniref:Uncharacterized protein n=1 Tax=Oryza rufipogon TaxID=4529 RepID=A0A0E0QSN2_ORYRU